MEFKLSAQKREKGEKLADTIIPAVLYGKGVENQSLKLNKIEFDKIFSAAGESNLIDIDYGSGPVKVLVKSIQRNPIKHTITHVDFYQVNMKEKVTTEIPLHFIGEPKAVKELGGMLMTEMDSVNVECLPSDLVDHIDVDISTLATFDDAIRLEDLNLPKGISLVNEHNEMVVSVKEPKVIEEEPVAAEEAPAENKEAAPEGDSDKKEETKE